MMQQIANRVLHTGQLPLAAIKILLLIRLAIPSIRSALTMVRQWGQCLPKRCTFVLLRKEMGKKRDILSDLAIRHLNTVQTENTTLRRDSFIKYSLSTE